MITSDAVKRRARELGFDLCGIAPVERFPELAYLREWLDRGYAGDMAWMARSADRRADVRRSSPAPAASSSPATLYNTDRPVFPDLPTDAARHCRGMRGATTTTTCSRRRLDALLTWMRGESPAPFEARAYVDTGPVQERVYAQYAGLGWIGKNTCLINAELGSWLFLAEIICTLPISSRTPQGLEQCGSCSVVSTPARPARWSSAGVLDSNRCLSYLTIELKAPLPEPLRPSTSGTHVYGCDICQDVCPYNRAGAALGRPRMAAAAGLDLPSWSSSGARRTTTCATRHEREPMTRAKLIGLRRNVAVAIGNSGDPDGARRARGDARPSAVRRRSAGPRTHVEWAR